MSETALKRAVVRVWQGEPKPGNASAIYCGTAFFIAPGYLLTAKHVVANRDNLWLQGNAWDGRTQDRANILALHPEADVALLAPGKADGPEGIPLFPQPVVLEPNETLTLWGYGSDGGELEAILTAIRGYLPDGGHECVHGNNASGMSGGPAVRERQGRRLLVGIVPGRYPDANKTAVVPLESFREFIRQHLNSASAPQSKITPSDEFLKLVRARISEELANHRDLHKALQQFMRLPDKSPEQISSRLCQEKNPRKAIIYLQNALDRVLTPQLPEQRTATRETGLLILGWLLLLSVDHRWIQHYQAGLAAGKAIDFIWPVRTPLGVEIIQACLFEIADLDNKARPARLTLDASSNTLISEHGLDTDNLLESGWKEEEVANTVMAELWARLFPRPGKDKDLDCKKFSFTETEIQDLNEAIIDAREMLVSGSPLHDPYLLIQAANKDNPLSDKATCRALIDKLQALGVVYYGSENGNTILIEAETGLENRLNLFLQSLNKYSYQ